MGTLLVTIGEAEITVASIVVQITIWAWFVAMVVQVRHPIVGAIGFGIPLVATALTVVYVGVKFLPQDAAPFLEGQGILTPIFWVLAIFVISILARGRKTQQIATVSTDPDLA